MKRSRLWAVMLAIVAVLIAGCGNGKNPAASEDNHNDEPATGSDWRTYQSYPIVTWNTPDGPSNFYVDIFEDSGKINFYVDAEVQAAFVELVPSIGVHDEKLITETLKMQDINGDGYDDITFTDTYDGTDYNQVYIYYIDKNQFYYSDEYSVITASDEPGKPVYSSTGVFDIYSGVLSEEAGMYPDSSYALADINEDMIYELFIVRPEAGIFVWSAKLEPDGATYTLIDANGIPGSENGVLVVGDEGIRMDAYYEGIHGIYSLGFDDNFEVTSALVESYAEDSYDFEGKLDTCPCTDESLLAAYYAY